MVRNETSRDIVDKGERGWWKVVRSWPSGPKRCEKIRFRAHVLSRPYNVVSDGRATVSVGDPTEHHYTALVAIIEDKNCIGEGGSDPYNQAAYAYHRYWADAQQDVLRLVCYCPTIIISVAGPWVCVAGGIYLNRAIVQPLTTGFTWVGPMTCSDVRRPHVERLFTALRKIIDEFGDHYKSLSGLVRGAPEDVKQQVFGFPPITNYSTDDGAVTFTYLEKLAPWIEDKLAFKARREKDEALLVVKFTSIYNERAHSLLAELGYAPKLYHISRLDCCALYLVVMQHVEGEHPLCKLTDEQRSMVREALTVLHDNQIVFGDLRAPNIIVENEGGRIKLVDFDECGEEDRGTYPFGINMRQITWADGVGPGSVMNRAHDFFMLDQL
ncbi:hypothetical protein EI94DRAFT_1160665 [Lactarius quietus]|nr:hypothetical protein EI94DRAFT_1160665 [Lactarius quietus]